MNAFIPDRNALDEAISNALKEHLDSTLPSLIREATRKEWLSSADVMEITGWSKRTLQNLRDQRRIKFYQDGYKILYKFSDLEYYLESIGVEPRKKEL